MKFTPKNGLNGPCIFINSLSQDIFDAHLLKLFYIYKYMGSNDVHSIVLKYSKIFSLKHAL